MPYKRLKKKIQAKQNFKKYTRLALALTIVFIDYLQKRLIKSDPK